DRDAGLVTVLPTVRVTAADASANEGGDTGAFKFTRDGDLTQSLLVSFTLAGSATLGGSNDYQLAPAPGTGPGGFRRTFPPNSTQLIVKVMPVNDPLVEQGENVVLSLAAVSGSYQVDPAAATATVDIADNDKPVIQAPATQQTDEDTDLVF